jgi:hypothetical protein
VPWVFAAGARPYFANKNRTDVGLRSTLEKEYDLIAELGKIATDRKIAISQPFAEGPSGRTEDVYPVLLAQFDRTPEPDQTALLAPQQFEMRRRDREVKDALLRAYGAVAL